ncbi:MAG TPA: helix-turn-helix transcriptional regulator [Candidatus Faecousia faecipullorum]|nr:helix-turn-helix transcriptional regulator [Candidatus Faecousia faecipullorum]
MRKRKDTLGDVVKQARIKNKVTVEELADKAGVSVRYIYRIESGDKKPSYEVFMELMDVLAIDSELICRPEKQAVESKAGDLIRMLCNCDNHTQDLVISVARAIISASAKDCTCE